MRSENHGRGIKNSLLLSVYFPHPQRHYTNLFSLRTLGALNPRCFLWTLSTITPSWGFAAIRHYKVALLPVHLRMRTDSLIFILYWHERIYLTVNWANQRENEIPWSEPHNLSVAIDAILQSGVSIKFEVGSWLEKNNRLYEQGTVRPLNLRGLGAGSPRKF